MKALADAVALRNQLIAMLEEADTECANDVRAQLLTFLVAGAGFAGVETAGSINNFLRSSVRFYPNLKRNDIRLVLVSVAFDWTLDVLFSKDLGQLTSVRAEDYCCQPPPNT